MAMPHFDSKHAGTIWWDDSDQTNKIMNVSFILIYIYIPANRMPCHMGFKL